MKLKEAIEASTYLCDKANEGITDNQCKAVRLGIEAMKMLKRMKDLGVVPETSLLPGETKD